MSSDKAFDDKLHKAYKQAKQSLEPKQKETNMTTTPSTKKTIIITVIATLTVLTVFAAQAMYFYNSGYNAKTADNLRIAEAVAKQASKTKQ